LSDETGVMSEAGTAPCFTQVIQLFQMLRQLVACRELVEAGLVWMGIRRVQRSQRAAEHALHVDA
jgi:hypothetical protein